MNTPKNIKILQIADVPIEDVRPGHVIVEGMVLSVRPDGPQGVYFIDTPLGVVYGQPGSKVQVLCALDEHLAEETLAKRDAETRRPAVRD